MITKNQIKNIKAHFKRYSKKYSIYKKGMNEFNEVIEKILVKEISGIFCPSTTKKDGYIKTKHGEVVQGAIHSLIVEDIQEIERYMYVIIGEKQYEIIDMENETDLDITYNLKLKEVDSSGSQIQ